MALMNSLRAGHLYGSSARIEHKSQLRSSSQRGHAQCNGLKLSNYVPWLCGQDLWCVHLWSSLRAVPRYSTRTGIVVSSSFNALTLPPADLVRVFSVTFTKVLSSLNAHPVLLNCVPPIAMIIFVMYGLVPCVKRIQRAVSKKKNWESSQVKHILVSYVRPFLLWMAVISICRAVDPVVLSTEASQEIKDRSVNFVRSLSTVLAFAVCTTKLTQQVQKSLERPDSDKGRNLGIQFISNAVCSSVWVAAVCLFMELLGFSTQKWITAGGLGTVLVTLAGREIFTNFLSSIMIHATRPFIETQWIQTKIEGQEVSGTVEHVGWWSPTVIRGDDREAVHIPNHKFTVSVVRNLSQKTHWRIKTHLAISHLDAGKIAHIVADMRKVLAKHSQVEHKRLHRRVFLDYIHPENQALHVLVSCFVKTSHFEEYLRVKESILLDLLRVISHHNARLATPIRVIQRLALDESQQQSSPHKYGRPLLISENSVLSDVPEQHNLSRSKSSAGVAETQQQKASSKPQLEGLDSMGLNSRDITLLGAAFGKPSAKDPSATQEAADDLEVDEEEGSQQQMIRGKKIYVQDDVKEQIVGSIRGTTADGSKKLPSSVEENLVLGVALEGSKRTLPLDDSPRNTDINEASQKPAADTTREKRER